MATLYLLSKLSFFGSLDAPSTRVTVMGPPVVVTSVLRTGLGFFSGILVS